MFHSGSSNHCISYHDSINFRIWRARRYMYRGRALQHFLTVQDCHKLLSSFGWIWDISKRGLEEIKRSRCSKLCFLPVFCSKLQIKHDLVCITLHRIWLAYAIFFSSKSAQMGKCLASFETSIPDFAKRMTYDDYATPC